MHKTRIILLVLLSFLPISRPAAALDYHEFSTEKCEFAMMFTDRPTLDQVRVSDTRLANRATMNVKYADSAISIRSVCFLAPSEQLATELQEDGIRKMLEQETKHLRLKKYKIEYKTVEDTRWGILTGIRLENQNTPKYFFKYLLVGRISMMTIDAVYVGRHPYLDEHFNGTLATLHVKPY